VKKAKAKIEIKKIKVAKVASLPSGASFWGKRTGCK
jgi:hypothetical protein